MLRTWFGIFFIAIAIVAALGGMFLPREQLPYLIRFTNFFDIMIPVLAVTAMINYIWKSNCCNH